MTSPQKGDKIATRDAYGTTLLALGQENPNIVILDSDLQGSVKHSAFAKNFPERSFNIGIAEKDMIGTACGLALTGKVPFAASFAVFTTGEGYNTIRQSVCYSNLDVKIIGAHAGILTGEDGATHQALEDINILRALPNIEIFSPADFYETQEVVKYAASSKKPCYIRLGRAGVPVVHDENFSFSPGQSYVLKDGNDAAVFCHGATVSNCLDAAKKLEEKNINVSVFSCPSIKPFDTKTLLSQAQKTKKIITVEDHSIYGGLGSTISEILSEKFPCSVYRHGMTTFGESGTPKELYKKYKLDAEGIYTTILNSLQ